MTSLPDRVLARSFNYLEAPELGRCRAACKKWAAILDSKDTYAVWRACCQNRYPDGVAERGREAWEPLAKQQWHEERPSTKHLYQFMNPNAQKTTHIVATDRTILIASGKLTCRSIKSEGGHSGSESIVQCLVQTDPDNVLVGFGYAERQYIIWTRCERPQLIEEEILGITDFPFAQMAASSSHLFFGGRDQGVVHATALKTKSLFQANLVRIMSTVLGKECANQSELYQVLQSLSEEEHNAKHQQAIPKMISFFKEHLISLNTEDVVTALHTDHERLFVGGLGKVRVYSLATLARSFVLDSGGGEPVWRIQSVRGSLFAAAGRKIHQFSCNTGIPEHLFDMEGPVHSFVIHNHILWANVGNLFSRLKRIDLKKRENPAVELPYVLLPNRGLIYHKGKLYFGNGVVTTICDLKSKAGSQTSISVDSLHRVIRELDYLAGNKTLWFKCKQAPDALVHSMPEAERNKLYERVWVLKGRPQGLPEPFGELSFHRRSPLPSAYFCTQKERNSLLGKTPLRKINSLIQRGIRHAWRALPLDLKNRIYEMAWELKGKPNRLRFGELSFHGAQNLPIDQQCTPVERQHLLKRALDERNQELNALSESLGFKD